MVAIKTFAVFCNLCWFLISLQCVLMSILPVGLNCGLDYEEILIRFFSILLPPFGILRLGMMSGAIWRR